MDGSVINPQLEWQDSIELISPLVGMPKLSSALRREQPRPTMMSRAANCRPCTHPVPGCLRAPSSLDHLPWLGTCWYIQAGLVSANHHVGFSRRETVAHHLAQANTANPSRFLSCCTRHAELPYIETTRCCFLGLFTCWLASLAPSSSSYINTTQTAMSRHKVPDAWDDDWEPEAATLPLEEAPKPQANTRMTKAERLALHEESNRKLWQSAYVKRAHPPKTLAASYLGTLLMLLETLPSDAPDDQPQYLPATNHVSPAVPVFKPSMKVLSRRPTPARAPGAGGAGAGAGDDDDDDDEEARRLAAMQPSPEEVRLRQQREREEKQRRYDEARAKIFGEAAAPSARPGATSSGASTPGAVTPPQQQACHQHHHQTEAASGGNHVGRQGGNRSRGRGAGGGRGGYRGESRSHDRGSNSNDGQVRRPPGTRGLYDPNSSPKPSQRRGGSEAASSGTTTPREEDQGRLQAFRSPRGPEAGGRGGFGFARRGGASDT